MNLKKMILLVDDDNRFRFAMATELRALGYLVVSAENGERAIRMIQESRKQDIRVDLVITDLVMPRKDGIRFCSELRTVDENMSVLVITGFMSAEAERALLELGCSDYLEKPFTPADLVEKVEKLIAGPTES